MNNKTKTYEFNLTYDEVLLLDKQEVLTKENQDKVNRIKEENSIGFQLDVMNEIIMASKKSGELTWRIKQIDHCEYCDKKRDYYRYTRSSRYHRKGDYNYDSPKYYTGYKFNEGFVTIKGRGDMCKECEEKYNVIHTLIDYIIDNDLKIEIQNNDYRFSKYIRTGNKWDEDREFILNPLFELDKIINPLKEIIKEYNNTIDEDNRDKIVRLWLSENKEYVFIDNSEWNNGTKIIEINIKDKTYKYADWFYKDYKFLEDEVSKYYKRIR